MNGRRDPGARRGGDLRPTVTGDASRRFLRRVHLLWEEGHLVVVDVDGRRHPLPEARSLALQTDHAIGVREIHGSHDLLLVLDQESRVLASAPKGPFDPHEVHEFCREHGLPLERRERTWQQPTMPAKAPGYRPLDVSWRTRVVLPPVLLASIAFGLLGPYPLLAAIGAGLVVDLILLMVLS